jgi:hypothetical protein
VQGYEQLLYLSQRMFQAGESGWAQAVYLAAMFAVVVWRKESVESWMLYRYSFLLYAASLVVPPIVLPLLQSSLAQNRNMGNLMPGGEVFTSIIYSSVWPLLFALAVVFGLASMMPRALLPYRPPQPPGPPVPHPLD